MIRLLYCTVVSFRHTHTPYRQCTGKNLRSQATRRSRCGGAPPARRCGPRPALTSTPAKFGKISSDVLHNLILYFAVVILREPSLRTREFGSEWASREGAGGKVYGLRRRRVRRLRARPAPRQRPAVLGAIVLPFSEPSLLPLEKKETTNLVSTASDHAIP